MQSQATMMKDPQWAALIMSGESEFWLDAYRTVNDEFEDDINRPVGTLVDAVSAMKLTAFRTFSAQFCIPAEEVEFVEALPTRWNLKEVGQRSGLAGFKFRKKGSRGSGILIRVEAQEIEANICQITQARVSLVGLDLE